MGALIQDLLSYSRIGTSEWRRQTVDLDAAVKHACENLRLAIAESRASVHSDPLPSVNGDRTLLTQLFQNLIGNALKYHSAEDPVIKVYAEETGPEWRFAVRDNGIGIPRAYQDQIFGVFKRLHGKNYPGTGIGLAICQRIVERHGGRIWVESEPGRGSTFFFTLPKK
jgi:signal transduction histidine kinase